VVPVRGGPTPKNWGRRGERAVGIGTKVRVGQNYVSAKLTSERVQFKEVPEMAYEQIILTKSAGVVTITFNRPEKLNAFTFKMLEEVK
jgi:hypothetical protein